MGDVGMAGRLVSAGGAAFGIVPVPDPWGRPTGPGGRLLVDIEMLSSDRLVCYLGRRVPTSALARLAAAYRRAAADPHPETTQPTVEIPEGGVTVAFVSSTERTVTVECSVVKTLETPAIERDRSTFEVERASFVTVADQLTAWVDELHAPADET